MCCDLFLWSSTKSFGLLLFSDNFHHWISSIRCDLSRHNEKRQTHTPRQEDRWDWYIFYRRTGNQKKNSISDKGDKHETNKCLSTKPPPPTLHPSPKAIDSRYFLSIFFRWIKFELNFHNGNGLGRVCNRLLARLHSLLSNKNIKKKRKKKVVVSIDTK